MLGEVGDGRLLGLGLGFGLGILGMGLGSFRRGVWRGVGRGLEVVDSSWLIESSKAFQFDGEGFDVVRHVVVEEVKPCVASLNLITAFPGF